MEKHFKRGLRIVCNERRSLEQLSEMDKSPSRHSEHIVVHNRVI